MMSIALSSENVLYFRLRIRHYNRNFRDKHNRHPPVLSWVIPSILSHTNHVKVICFSSFSKFTISPLRAHQRKYKGAEVLVATTAFCRPKTSFCLGIWWYNFSSPTKVDVVRRIIPKLNMLEFIKQSTLNQILFIFDKDMRYMQTKVYIPTRHMDPYGG